MTELAARQPAPSQAVVVQGLTKRYGAGLAVDNLELAVPRGAVPRIVGAQWRRQEHTPCMIMGLLRPTAGTVRCSISIRSGLPQSSASTDRLRSETPQIYRWMTVREVVRFCCAL